MENTGNMMTALFRDWSDAENTYQELLNRSFKRDEISVLMSEEARSRYDGTTTEMGSKAAEGLGTGVAIGSTTGLIIGAIAAIGTSLVIPGLGLIIAGPLAAALVGAGAGGATGGLVGALIGAGIPEETVRHYENGLKEGGIVLGVVPQTAEKADEVEKIWQDYHGEMIYR